MPTYQGIVRDKKAILPEDARIREGSAVSVVVPDEAVDHEALAQQDVEAAGLVVEAHSATRPPVWERHRIEAPGPPLSRVIIDERG